MALPHGAVDWSVVCDCGVPWLYSVTLWLHYFNSPPVSIMWLFLKLPWDGLQCVIVIFLGHTHLLYAMQDTDGSQGSVFDINVTCAYLGKMLTGKERSLH